MEVQAQEKNKAATDLLAWFLNVVSSVLIVFVNKVLMDPNWGHKFVFATTLCSFHFFASGATVWVSEYLGFGTPARLPWRDTLIFSVVASASIASLNLSLLVNSVGFYQVSKLLIIPFVCLVEYIWLRRRFTVPAVISILIVVAGVAVVTVTDLGMNNMSMLGLGIAITSVITSGMQQILCGQVQRKHSMTSNQLLSNTAPIQGVMLLVVGPFMDKVVAGKWILDYVPTAAATQWLLLSCSVAVLVNISQFMCLGRFSAVTFQVLGHTKTVLVLLVGWLYLNDVMTQRKLLGIALAVVGMVAYGWSTSTAQALKAAAGTGSVSMPLLPRSNRPDKDKASSELENGGRAGRGYAP